jgi:adenylate kinase
MSIVITGNPGVGKHTISKSLAKVLGYEILDINKIALEFNLYEKTAETIDVDVLKLKNLLKKKISKKSLIVGHLAPYVLTKSQISQAIILRKNPYKLAQIYRKRKYSKRKTAENLGSEVLGIIAYETIKKFGKNKSIQVDTSLKSPTNITNRIKDILNGKSKSDSVDWLAAITEKKDLQKFFPY